MSLQDLLVVFKKGNSRSGDWGHRGRPGRVGGSGGGGGLASLGLKPDATPEERRARSNMARTLQGIHSGKIKGAMINVENLPDWMQKRLAYKPDDAGSSLKGQSQKKPSKLLKDGDAGKMLKDGRIESLDYGKTAEQILELAQRDNPELTQAVFNYVQGLSDYQDESGMRFGNVRVRAVKSSRFEVIAEILDSQGYKVGDLQRDFNLDTKDVHHSFMQLGKSAQGTGFASRFYYESEKAYKESGFETVSILANIDVGGYAWARMGYDASKPEQLAMYQSMLNTVYKMKYGNSIEVDYGKVPQTMSEIAAFTAPDGERLGKRTLLNEYWSAVKKLDDNDPSYQAGLEYYRQKGIEAD